MNDERQSRLLADFLTALRDDVHAAPPDALDPELVMIARYLVMAKTPLPDSAMRERVWQRALSATRPTHSTNGHQPHTPLEAFPMTAISRPAPRGLTTYPFTLVAALILVAAAALLFLNRLPPGPEEEQPSMFGNAAEQEASATPTALPTLLPPTVVPPTEAVIAHRIQSGETLFYILHLYGYTDIGVVDRIVALNPGMTADRLPAVGETLLLPAPATIPLMTVTPELIVHTVVAGETLTSILEQYGLHTPEVIDEIAQLNPAIAAGSLTEGSILLIPRAVPTPAESATPVPFTLSPLATATPVPFQLPAAAQPPTEVFAGSVQIPTLVPAAVSALIETRDSSLPSGASIEQGALPVSVPTLFPATLVPPSAVTLVTVVPIDGTAVNGLSLNDGPQQLSFGDQYQARLVFDAMAEQTVQLNVRAVSGADQALFIGLIVMQNGLLIADVSRDEGAASDGLLLSSGEVRVPQNGPVEIRLTVFTTADNDAPLVVEVALQPQG